MMSHKLHVWPRNQGDHNVITMGEIHYLWGTQKKGRWSARGMPCWPFLWLLRDGASWIHTKRPNYYQKVLLGGHLSPLRCCATQTTGPAGKWDLGSFILTTHPPIQCIWLSWPNTTFLCFVRLSTHPLSQNGSWQFLTNRIFCSLM